MESDYHSQIRTMVSFFWKQTCRAFLLIASLSACWLSNIRESHTQIIPDTTLPNNTVVIPNNTTSIIEGGTQVGSNLFHSFQEFSVLTGNVAFFNNAGDIQNIISRVTGGTLSNIDGLIGTNSTANLFLINPNGIIFSPNAQLSLGGSFIGSTATSPVSLPLPTSSNVGLQVLPGRTLALIGGDLSLNNGNLTALSGEIQLASVASPGRVSFIPTATGLAADGRLELVASVPDVTPPHLWHQLTTCSQ